MPTVEIGRFPAQDKLGRTFTIVVLQEIIDCPTSGDPTGTSEGIKHLRTAAGERVNRMGGGRFRILCGTRTIDVESTDPLATGI